MKPETEHDIHLLATPFRWIENITKDIFMVIVLFTVGPFLLIYGIYQALSGNAKYLHELLWTGGVLFLCAMPWSLLGLAVFLIIGYAFSVAIWEWFYYDFLDKPLTKNDLRKIYGDDE